MKTTSLAVASLLAVLLSLCMALQRDRAAFDAYRAYESARENLEALQRTVGHVNAAFVCRSVR